MIVRKEDCVEAPGFMAPGRINLLLIFIFKKMQCEISHLKFKGLVEENLYHIILIMSVCLLICHSKWNKVKVDFQFKNKTVPLPNLPTSHTTNMSP